MTDFCVDTTLSPRRACVWSAKVMNMRLTGWGLGVSIVNDCFYMHTSILTHMLTLYPDDLRPGYDRRNCFLLGKKMRFFVVSNKQKQRYFRSERNI